MPLVRILDRYEASRLSEGAATPQRCIELKKNVNKIIDDMKWTTLGDIDTESIDRWRSTRENGKGTRKPIADLRAVIRFAFDTLNLSVDQRLLIAKRRRNQNKKKKTPKYTLLQIAQIVDAAHKVGGFSPGVTVEHLALCPCRPIDVARCKVADWNGPARAITYRDTKNHDDITTVVPAVHAQRLDKLAEGKEPDDYLFLDPWGRCWLDKRGRAGRLSSWYAQNIGEHLLPPGMRGVYKLKKFGMSNLSIAAKGNREGIMLISGHRDESVVDRYMETNADEQRIIVDAIPELPKLEHQSQVLKNEKFDSTDGSTTVESGRMSKPRLRRKRLPILSDAKPVDERRA